LSVDENEANMMEEIGNVKTGQVTYAVRNTVIDDKEIHEGDYMGIGDKGILAVGQDMEATTLEMVAEMVDDESGLISIYYGNDVDEETAEALVEKLEEAYPDCDVELQMGGQPVYYYVISVE
jgi:dihydroxyacetone kinase-like predicted kinase